ncbi:TPA: hypothetical protein I7680_21070 [Vibrio vulnificus]|uniref:hypothetical protein n=1 Tax=Vibrio vulnificus TaxID=672 RepID=UPI001A33600D|nr:hypothetical protein [Vibrio vulnificus]MCG6277927.1 hypothetical protein [Vibrio vulnificus]HAS8173975.1 hypothetical protein [Vibrio vulnificus]HDY7726958.1 hypothetical protein [Vibrio vulnificus]
MEGRPPQILENIEWLRVNFLKYSLHIALAVSVFVGGHYYTKYESLKAESNLEIETLNERLVDYQGCRTVSPHGDQPLQVTFTDGRVAYANSFSVILPAANSDYYKQEYRDTYIRRYESALQSLKAAIYIELESVALDFARTNRELLADRIVERVKPKLQMHELEMSQFELLELCSPSK